jgi:hypothetical protein
MKTIFKLKISGVIILLLLTVQAQSQGFYVTAGAGYGISPMGISSNWEGYESINYYINTTTDTWDGVSHHEQTQNENSGTDTRIKGSGSYGKGIQVGATFGYMFNENISAELGFGYLIGTKIWSIKGESYYTDEQKYVDETNPALNTISTSQSFSTYESKASGNMLRIIPAMRFSAGNGAIKPYARIGLVIGVANKTKGYSNMAGSDYMGVSTVMKYEYKRTGGISLGFAGALGANYKLNDLLGIFAEVSIITQSWAPKKSELTEFTINGEDKFSELTTSEIETEYENSYSFSSTDDDENSPRKSLKGSLPFSSIGLNLGLSFAFGVK